jgi:hypothetical protein
VRTHATPARDAALTVPAAATSASFDLPIMVFLPLTGRPGHDARVADCAAQMGSLSEIFNRGIFEWTVHEDETVERGVPQETSADCSLRPHKLFRFRSLIERHCRSHLRGNGGAAGSCVPLARKRGR